MRSERRCAKRVIVQISSPDLEFSGAYEPTGDVLYLSTPADDKSRPAHQTPEGHAVRFAPDGQITHITAINARWLLERDGELTATLSDGRRLRFGRDDLHDLIR